MEENIYQEQERYPYQARVVGQLAVPKAYHYSKWSFLREMILQLSPEKAIRIVIPVGGTWHGVLMAWSKYTKEKRVYGHTRRVKQVGGSYVIYLWYTET